MAKYFERIIISPESHYSLAEYRTLMFSLVSGCPRKRSSFTYNISPGSICSNGSSEPNNENKSSDVKLNLHVRPPPISDHLYITPKFSQLTHSPLSHPKPPVRIHVSSTACDVISFNGHGQFYPLACAEWRDLSNYTRMSTIESGTLEKKAKTHVNIDLKILMKILFHCPPTFPFI